MKKVSKGIRVAKVSDLPPGECGFVDADGVPLAVFNVDGSFYAIDDACPHQGGPLSEAEIDGCVVACPWHGWRFDLKNGHCVDPPGMPSVVTYPVYIEGDDLFVEIEQST